MRASRWELFPPIVFVVWTAAILYLSLHPDPPQMSSPFLSWDKFQHAAAFGVLAFFGGLSFLPRVRSFSRAWFLGFLAALVIGAVVEVAQGALTPGRMAEWGDLAADAVGAAAASVAAWPLSRRLSL